MGGRPRSVQGYNPLDGRVCLEMRVFPLDWGREFLKRGARSITVEVAEDHQEREPRKLRLVTRPVAEQAEFESGQFRPKILKIEKDTGDGDLYTLT